MQHYNFPSAISPIQELERDGPGEPRVSTKQNKIMNKLLEVRRTADFQNLTQAVDNPLSFNKQYEILKNEQFNTDLSMNQSREEEKNFRKEIKNTVLSSARRENHLSGNETAVSPAIPIIDVKATEAMMFQLMEDRPTERIQINSAHRPTTGSHASTRKSANFRDGGRKSDNYQMYSNKMLQKSKSGMSGFSGGQQPQNTQRSQNNLHTSINQIER